MSATFSESIERLKQSVRMMIAERAGCSDQVSQPSDFWSGSLSVFEYLINLSSRDFENIRFHTSLITGESTHTYAHLNPPPDGVAFANSIGYAFYTSNIPEAFWLGEPPAPRMPYPLGLTYKGRIINNDTTRYQSCVANLYTAGFLTELLNSTRRSVILEVGGGYGGMANHLGNLLSGRATYIILDLPEMFLFSGAYLSLLNPNKRIYFYDKSTFTNEFLQRGLFDYDYVLLPNYVTAQLAEMGPDLELMLNMQSFQEMTPAQIDQYAAFGAKKVTGYIYSNNLDCHPINEVLAPGTVSSHLNKFFQLFPAPEIYDQKVQGINLLWCHRAYLGTSRLRPRAFPPNATLRYAWAGQGYEFTVS